MLTRPPDRSGDGPPDEELVERFQAGDEGAFNLIVSRHGSKITTLCTYYLKDPEEAADLAQEVFLKAYRGLARFRGDAKLSTWLHTVALNACRNRGSFWRRLADRRRRFDADPTTDFAPRRPDEIAEQDEKRRILSKEIRELPEKFRVMIVMKDIQGASYEEIGETLGLNTGTVKSRLHRAREALQVRLERALGS